jgi:hypothetical protein
MQYPSDNKSASTNPYSARASQSIGNATIPGISGSSSTPSQYSAPPPTYASLGFARLKDDTTNQQPASKPSSAAANSSIATRDDNQSTPQQSNPPVNYQHSHALANSVMKATKSVAGKLMKTHGTYDLWPKICKTAIELSVEAEADTKSMASQALNGARRSYLTNICNSLRSLPDGTLSPERVKTGVKKIFADAVSAQAKSGEGEADWAKTLKTVMVQIDRCGEWPKERR